MSAIDVNVLNNLAEAEKQGQGWSVYNEESDTRFYLKAVHADLRAAIETGDSDAALKYLADAKALAEGCPSESLHNAYIGLESALGTAPVKEEETENEEVAA